MEYFFDENDQLNSPFIANKVDPIQMPGLDIDDFKKGRAAFTDEEWINAEAFFSSLPLANDPEAI